MLVSNSTPLGESSTKAYLITITIQMGTIGTPSLCRPENLIVQHLLIFSVFLSLTGLLVLDNSEGGGGGGGGGVEYNASNEI